jgi:ribose transport system ATP-binding protein
VHDADTRQANTLPPAHRSLPILSFAHVDKIFGDSYAVADVSFDCHAGEIVALLGENGAGKSTLIKILAGVYRRDGGDVQFQSKTIDAPGARDGLAFIHQDLGLIDWMTVSENMALGFGFGTTSKFRPFHPAAIRDRASKALALVGGEIDPASRVFDLTRAEKSLLAIARALALNAKFLVLDEPTASLPHADVAKLFDVLRRLRSEGVGMIYVSHRLDEVFEIADHVAVMRNGRLVGYRPVAQTTQNELVTLIVGRELDRKVNSAPVNQELQTRVELRNAMIGDVGPVNLKILPGEIVGLVGLRGAGQTNVGRAIAGVERLSDGTLELDGTVVVARTPRDAALAGISFATSNRESEGLSNGMSVRENIFVNPHLWGRQLFTSIKRKTERHRAASVVQRFGIRPSDTEKIADTLSGGNQQKVILSRWIGIARQALVLEEPTMGVDVGAKADIYRLINESTSAGTAVAVISTDFEEVASICHRVLVFSRGLCVAELNREQLSVSALLAAASGSSELISGHMNAHTTKRDAQ